MSLIIHNAIFLFKKVEMGSFEHVLPVFFAIIIGFFAIKYVIRKFNNTKKDLLFNILGIAISLTIILFHGYSYFRHSQK